MKQQTIYVDGVYTGHLNDGTMEWTCPFTNELRSAWGQFYVTDEGYEHIVCDRYGNESYVVIGREVKR